MKLWTPSLRVKLTLWFLLTFTTVFAGFLFSAWWLYRDAARRATDDRLLGIAEGIAEQLRDPTDPSSNLMGGDLRPLQTRDRRYSLLAVRDEAGRVLASQWSLDTSFLPPVEPNELATEAEFHSIEGKVSEALIGRSVASRMITYSFPRDDGETLYIDVAQTTDIRAPEHTFVVNAVLVGALGALIASTVAAWIIAGKAVAPFEELTKAARAVNPDHFDTRLNIDSTEHEVSRLQTELNDALGRLEEGYRAQERFISHVAHDLKTPIAVMLSQSEVLRLDRAPPTEVEAYRRSMIEEMRKLGRLVGGFLTLARADQADALARQTNVPANELILESVLHCNAFAGQMDVRLIPRLIEIEDSDVDPEIEGDPDLLRTMLDNLIRNAVQHSPAHSRVGITAHLENHSAVISVRDHGPGIPEPFLDKIFERFIQVPDTPRRMDGSGLGLAIAKRVAEMHGGSIEVTNCDDGGCTFTVRLPLRGSISTPQVMNGAEPLGVSVPSAAENAI